MKIILVFLFSISSFASISEAQFYSIPNEIINLFDSEIKDAGLSVSLKQDWNSATVNAGASRSGYSAVISLYGAHAKIAPMTPETYAMTICHELGHLIGGLPKVMPTGKYSSEGQSDYFATNTCLKKYLENKVSDIEVPKFHLELCLNQFSTQTDIIMCKNLMKISIDHLSVDNYLAPRESYDDMFKLDDSITNVTNFNDYPQVSCRYTTYINGALNKEKPECWFNSKNKLVENSYILDYIYPESMFIGTAYDVKQSVMGCSFKVKDISYFGEGMFESVDEGDLYKTNLYNFKECRFKNEESISGSVTSYLGKLYLNLNNTDK